MCWSHTCDQMMLLLSIRCITFAKLLSTVESWFLCKVEMMLFGHRAVRKIIETG
jgi:hypothetical protein